jgi:hypothetical protein
VVTGNGRRQGRSKGRLRSGRRGRGGYLGFALFYMNADNFSVLISGWPKIMLCSCRATVPRAQPRPV